MTDWVFLDPGCGAGMTFGNTKLLRLVSEKLHCVVFTVHRVLPNYALTVSTILAKILG